MPGGIGLIAVVFANGHIDILPVLSIYLSFAVAAVFRKISSFATYKTCFVFSCGVLFLEVSGFLRLNTSLHLSLIVVVDYFYQQQHLH
jgi:hypothetical protein